MYDLPYHKAKNDEVIKEFVDQYPFAFVSGCDENNRPVATQLPIFFEDRGNKKVLRGHLMKNTDHHRAFVQNENVLAVFTGKHTYVSGTWYSNPHTPSTWNYMSVHARGVMKFLDDQALEDVLRMTSLHFEGQNSESATVFDNLPKAYLQRMMGAVVAFEIEVTNLDTVFKLSQDRDAESYRTIIEKLKAQDEDGRVMAHEMEKRAKELFPERTNPLIPF
jgi:transcriptional regulator